jgi:hypothetical protein
MPRQAPGVLWEELVAARADLSLSLSVSLEKEHNARICALTLQSINTPYHLLQPRRSRAGEDHLPGSENDSSVSAAIAWVQELN